MKYFSCLAAWLALGLAARLAAAQPAFFVRGGSLNLDYAPSRHVLVRLEGKLLNSRNARFVSDRGPNATKYGNLTGTVAFSF